MELNQLIEELRATVEKARQLPMSASVVVSRTEILQQIDAVEAALPAAFAVFEREADRDHVAARAREDADQIIGAATLERDRLLAESDVVRSGREEVEQLRLTVERECEELRRETDEYVDGRLANLELSLTKTLEAVARGRERLHGRSDLDPLSESRDGDEFTFPD